MDALFCKLSYRLCKKFPEVSFPKCVLEAAAVHYRHVILRMP